MLLPDHRLDIPGPLHWDPDLLRYLGNPGRFRSRSHPSQDAQF